MKAAIWASVASPARISPMAAPDCAAVRSWPAVSTPRTSRQPPRAARSVASDRFVTTARLLEGWRRAGPGSGRSGRAAALADDAAPLTLGGPAPHAVLLASARACSRQASRTGHGRTDRLGRLGFGVVLGGRDRRCRGRGPGRRPCERHGRFIGRARTPPVPGGGYVGGDVRVSPGQGESQNESRQEGSASSALSCPAGRPAAPTGCPR